MVAINIVCRPLLHQFILDRCYTRSMGNILLSLTAAAAGIYPRHWSPRPPPAEAPTFDDEYSDCSSIDSSEDEDNLAVGVVLIRYSYVRHAIRHRADPLNRPRELPPQFLVGHPAEVSVSTYRRMMGRAPPPLPPGEERARFPR